MKIALCISGQPRFVQEGWFFHQRNLIEPYGCDVFIHSWAMKDNSERFYEERYRPKSILVEPQVAQDPLGFYSYFNVVSAMKSHKKVNELKSAYEVQNNFKYDIVVKSRSDLAVRDRLKFDQYDLSKMNCMRFRDGERNCDIPRDWMFLSSSPVMDIISKCYDYAAPLYENKHEPNHRPAENIMADYLGIHGIGLHHVVFDNFIMRYKGYPYYADPEHENIVAKVRADMGIS